MGYKLGRDGFARGNERYGSGGGAIKKPRQYLVGDYVKDMKTLRMLGRINNPQKRIDEPKNEPPVFVTYLTLALQNLSEIMGKDAHCDLSGKRSVKDVKDLLLEKKRLPEIASFLWTHRAQDPARDFAMDQEKWTIAIVLKLWELRNMFVHPRDSKALFVTPDFYRFVEGELYAAAREDALGPGRKSEKVFKLRLFTPNNDAKTRYEFTRKGLIFLVCLALYRHDAVEFIAQFPDLQLPPREWEMEKGIKKRPNEADLIALRKKGGSVKAILDAFTYYSMRSSRTDIDVQNADYLNFANILLYLNKVPMAAYDYLSLDAEVEKMRSAAANAEKQVIPESEENRRFKYLLQARRKDRFLQLAVAYLEDFHKLDCIRFKRLDITVRPDRKHYMFGPIPKGEKNEFGEEISDVNGMDRHYAISHGAIGFAFIPESHYGDVKIASLRGAISEDEILRLLLVIHDGQIRRQAPNEALKDYLTAYHRILERMLNAKDTGTLTLEDAQFRADFKRVSGKGEDALAKERFVEEMKPFFSQAITRYFVGDDRQPSTMELQHRLDQRLTVMKGRAGDFLVKLDKLTNWRQLDAEARKKAGFPICALGELRYPPRTCKITDAQLVQWVLRYLNLYLTAANKYRQLPRYARHRGVKDFEFQLLHADIGRFGVNPSNLWRTLERREGLNGPGGPLEVLKAREGELFCEEQRRCRNKRDKNGQPLRVRHTLTMLASAAAELYADWCEELRSAWCGVLSAEDVECLPYACRQYGVRTGQPLDRVSLVKTVLGIDLSTWSRAYDYAKGAPHENRTLAGAPGLTATQIPVPNQIALRCVKPSDDGADFLFGPAFRAFQPWEVGRMALRDYYGVAPLVDYVKTHKKSGPDVDLAAKGVETRGGQDFDETAGNVGKNPPRKVEFTKTEVDKAIQAIKLAERQDKALLACAKDYWERYMRVEVTTTEKDKIKGFKLAESTDVYAFFDTPICDKIEGVSVWMMPNDFARPAYGVVASHVKELVGKCEPNEKGEYAFYDLWLALRDLQREESDIRLACLPAVVEFNDVLAIPPELERLSNSDPEKLPRTLAHCNAMLHARNANPLTREEYFAVAALEVRLRHPRLKKNGKYETLVTFDRNPALAVLRRFGFLK